MLIKKIKELAERIHPQVIDYRRHLHQNPELSFNEFKTSDFIKTQLQQLQIPFTSMANTGIMAQIKSNSPSERVIALRADMDALAITEENNFAYCSKQKGVMHACGHDAHTASLLGTATILNTLKNEFAGTINLVFQPAEEILPGGASLMIREGVLENPATHAMIGQHVSPMIDAGKIGIRPGRFMASMDELTMTIQGKGGHGAQPHQNIDPVLIASHIIVALQQICSRIANPKNPTVLSFGKFIANGSFNIIPDKVVVEGTFRTLDEAWREEAHNRMIKMATGIAESMGATCTFSIRKGYPFLNNDEVLTSGIMEYATAYYGAENIVDLDVWMAAEDFAYYAQLVPSCFYLLGVRNEEKGITSSLHTPTFDIDEEALRQSTGFMAYAAVQALQQPGERRA
jgi:amidohydrolase